MNTETISDRINTVSASLDGVTAFLYDLVDSGDLTASRKAYTLADLTRRMVSELSQTAVDISRLERDIAGGAA